MLQPDAIAQVARDAGPVDILFNCAGFMHQGALMDAAEDEWSSPRPQRALDVPTMQAFLPGMLQRGGGVVINMASVASSLKGVPNRFIYSAPRRR